MSLEAIYARKNASLFSLPINRFTNWGTVRKEFNIKQCYQAGSGPIWWFVGEFLSGNTHDPKDVFKETKAAFDRGNHPVLCVSQNYDFSGAPHCILPVRWDSSKKPWEITICDPNSPNALKKLTVNPDNNTYKYVGSKTYKGGEWSGGRLHYIPFTRLNKEPRTPIWDAILLLLSGTIILLGDDVETVSIKDRNGNDIDAYGSRAKKQLKEGCSLNGYFVGVKGYGNPPRPIPNPDRVRRIPTRLNRRTIQPIVHRGKGTFPGEMLIRIKPVSHAIVAGPAAANSSIIAHMPIGSLTANRHLRSVRDAFRGNSAAMRNLRSRTLHHIAADASARAVLDETARGVIAGALSAAGLGDYNHNVRGLRNGAFQYLAKHGLNQVTLNSTVASGEKTQIEATDLGTSKNVVKFKPDRDKAIDMEVDNKLGVAGDRIRIKISKIPTAKNKKFEINLRPGLGGLDIMTPSEGASVQIQLQAKIGNSKIKRKFTASLDRGTRIKVASALTSNELSLARIDRLFGPTQASRIIRGQ